ncbi:MAG: kelch repeat-containing protein [Pyrinomonadaceae bacterium]
MLIEGLKFQFPVALLVFFLITNIFAGSRINGSCPKTLSVRNGHRLIYDSGRKKVVLFGGADASQVLGDLWEWNGKGWRCLDSTPELARTFPAMAFDSDRKKIVLFGGNRVLFGKADDDEAFLDDTWEWDGKRWSKLEIKGPPARAEAVMVYDQKRKRAVLFGGYVSKDGQTARFGDTWEFDGRSWKRVSVTGPSPRNGAAMIYDPNKERSVLFGGSGKPNGTWEWDGKNWSRTDTNEVEGVFNTVMAYDPKNKSIIRFGGWNGESRTGDTWKFDGKIWKSLDIDGPEARNHSAMVYDAARDRMILFGGHDGENVFGDTWEFDGRKWSRKSFIAKQKRVENGH